MRRPSYIELMRRQFPKSAPRSRQGGALNLNALSGFWARQAAGGPAFLVDAADFDGTNDMMRRASAYTSVANTDSGIASIWFYLENASGTPSGLGGVVVLYQSKNAGSSSHAEFTIDNTGATPKVSPFIGSGIADGGLTIYQPKYLGVAGNLGADANNVVTRNAWQHLLQSWDVSNGTYWVALNGVLLGDSTGDKSNPGSWTNTAWTGSTNNSFAGLSGGFSAGTVMDGGMAECYLALGATALDLSNPANVQKFRSTLGKPVNLGTDGSIPTGTAATVYQHLDDGEAAANFATNRGSGGNFTITGTLTTFATSPSD